MRVRRAHSLLMFYYDQEIGVHNFLSKTRFACSTECLEFLEMLDDWRTTNEILELYPSIDKENLAEQIESLIKLGALIVEDTSQDQVDRIFRKSWQWGMANGYFHFLTRDAEFPRDYTKRDLLSRREEWGQTEPEYVKSPGADADVISLPKMDFQDNFFAVMRNRRSKTRYSENMISLKSFSDCLYAGKGILGFQGDGKNGNRKPIAMAPSADACSPYELYVYANKVEGLRRGFYHYAALDHNLVKIKDAELDVASMLGNQAWTSTAAAIIFFVAFFPRAMWSFHKPIGYRMTLIEAGFIGQNIALAATRHSLSAVPVGSILQSLVEPHLNLNSIESSVMLAMAVGQPLD